MNRTSKWVLGTMLIALAFYVIAPQGPSAIGSPAFWVYRHELVLVSGVVSLALMTLCVILAVRLKWMEPLTRGLDKSYAIHKWAGIAVTFTVTVHWLAEKFPKWTRDIFSYPPKMKNPNFHVLPWQKDIYHLGNTLVENAIYVILLLLIIALFKRVPYRTFRATHKVFPILFLIAAFHSVTILYKADWMGTPTGYAVILLSVVGSLAALVSLGQQIGANRKISAEVAKFDVQGPGIVDLWLKNTTRPLGHTAGQFVFLSFAHDSEPHPFSLASAPQDTDTLRFGIKTNGDFTDRLPERLRVGEAVRIEGPYGHFSFDLPHGRQVWVAGGIGITPFLSRLDELARTGRSSAEIDLWYCCREASGAAYPDNLKELCQAAGVTLHVVLSSTGERLTGERLKEVHGSLEDTAILFCGPAAFRTCLLDSLKAQGFDTRAFHSDSFDMR
ncbi:ferric reductase-like transmembrane domain-containing protein [Phaeovibrio sulfidiphilus]|uniref:Ferric reductase-like transmembrane domain-containing protein n=1 Tax=Phaeovibrio sulfidiphilus TaxID=1220600 RepID=A0A8J6YTH4_9PROT|nr:ferric reductase-like transmembrane domain-containing protein [Phaeovibrio sulfidiphilus]MBE1236119.1 ferric reductase-like transmembrane domain-containing protein [Phaeovibrio sulfidiphilus]